MGRPAVLKIDIIADAKQVGPGVSQAEGKLSKLGKTAGRVGKLAAFGLAGGLAAAGAGAFKLAQGAAEDEAGQKRLAVALRNTTGATGKQVAATESWITAQGKSLGVADDELRPALARLAATTHDVGKAQKLTSLAMDISAGTGKSLEAVSTALAKAQTGQVGGLSRLGVATKDAAGKTLSLDAITGQLAKTYKGQASAAANTTAGKFGRLKLQLSEVGETIGSKMLPVANKLAGYLLKRVLPAAIRLGGWLSRNLGPIFARLGAFISTKVVPVLRSLVSWFVDKIVPAIRRYLTPILAGARQAFGQVAAAVNRNKPALSAFLSTVRRVVEFLAKHVLPLVGRAIGIAFGTMGYAIGKAIDIVSTLVNIISSAVSGIRRLISWIGKIKMPHISLPSFITGGVGNLTTVGPALVGSSPSYDRRNGWSTAALGTALTAVRSSSSSSSSSSTPASIDARTFITVEGVVDEALVRKLDEMLARRNRRLGIR